MSKISLKQMSNEDGWVRGADAKAVGLLSQGLGAGRSLPDDVRSYDVKSCLSKGVSCDLVDE